MLKQGSIVRATVYDPQGRNPKVRPLVIVTTTAEITATEPIAVVAITGTFSNPPADHEIVLPWHRSGTVCTGLRKESVANCRWQEEILKSDVVDDKGRYIPNRHLAMILEQIEKIGQETEPPAA